MKNYLENEINKLIKQIIKTKKGFGWKNFANRNHEGIYISGEPFDYCIFTNENKVCFDAKMVDGKTWNVKDKDIKQGFNLNKVSKTGIECFFLILFTVNNKRYLRQISIDSFFEILQSRKAIHIQECKTFNYKRFL